MRLDTTNVVMAVFIASFMGAALGSEVSKSLRYLFCKRFDTVRSMMTGCCLLEKQSRNRSRPDRPDLFPSYARAAVLSGDWYGLQVALEHRAGTLHRRKLHDLGDAIINEDTSNIHLEQQEYDTELLTDISIIQGGETANLDAWQIVRNRVLSAVWSSRAPVS